MSYDNVKVSEINKRFDLERQQEARDNLASNSALQAFMAEVRKAFRGILFTPVVGDKGRVYVHMPNDPYILGWIGYGDFQTTVSADQKSYTVYSKNIMNMKYADYNDQYYMAMSVNLSTAVRNAKKYLRPLTTKDMAIEEYDTMIKLSEKSKDKAELLRTNALMDLLRQSVSGKTNALVEYMRALVSVGHEFTDKELEGTLLNYFKAEEEANVLKKKKVKTLFVRIYEKYGKQVFDVVSVIKNPQRWGHIADSLTTYDKDKVPEDIMGKVSVLSMVDNGHWVDDVGYRVDATMFHVTAPDDE
jgi:hypothetical protein